jgi:PHP family Zn ribbon phosphoesterase
VKTACKYCECKEEYKNKHSQKWHCNKCNRMKDYVADAEVLDFVYEWKG